MWHYQEWMLGLLGASVLVGFVLGVFVFIAVFLRVKAQVAWMKAARAAAGAVAVLSLLSHILVLDYPGGSCSIWSKCLGRSTDAHSTRRVVDVSRDARSADMSA